MSTVEKTGNEIEQSLSESALHQLLTSLTSKFAEYGIKLVVAVLFLIITFKLIKYFRKFLAKIFSRQGLEKSVSTFLLSFTEILLKVLMLLTAISIIGIRATSLITVLGTGTFTIGMALQGSLANFAGGVLILILKPYRAGDYIKTAAGEEGVVSSIDIFYTKLRTIDNQIVMIPNGQLSNGSITNVTSPDDRRIDIIVGVGYGEDLDRVKSVFNQVLSKEENIIGSGDRMTEVYVDALSDSSVNIGIRAWVKTEAYWDTRHRLLENIKKACDRENIEIPYNTVSVSVKKEEQHT